MLERGAPPYKIEVETRTHFALIAAVEAVIPCLADWIQTTGFGETHCRDLNALNLCKKAIDALRGENNTQPVSE